MVSRRNLLRSGALTAAGGFGGCLRLLGEGTPSPTGRRQTDGGATTTDEYGTPTGTAVDGAGTGDTDTETPGDDGETTPAEDEEMETTTPADCEPIPVSEAITSDTTWGASEDCPRIELQRGIRIESGATLTIEPGVEVIATEGRSLFTNTGGTLKAIGSPEAPIFFHGVADAPGFWGGIAINSRTDNEIRNVIVRHGGDNNGANIRVDRDGRLSLTNSRLEKSSKYGLRIEGGANLTDFSSNVFRNNERSGVRVSTRHLGTLDAASTYAANNGTPYIEVDGDKVTADATWPAPDAPYLLRTGFFIDGAAVIINPGARFHVTDGRELTVNKGSLTAAGEAGSEIVFDGTDDAPGFWQGLTVVSNNPDNELRNVVVRHAGDNDRAAVWVDGEGQLSLASTTVERTDANGMRVRRGGELPTFAGNTFRNNAGAPIRVHARDVRMLDTDSTYAADNGRDVILVGGGELVTDQTWPVPGVPYRLVSGGLDIAGANLSLEAGSQLIFSEGRGLSVRSGGSLTATGTDDAPVLFTAATETRGFWRGIYFGTSNENNVLDGAEVAYGGDNNEANVVVGRDSAATVRNSLLRDSSTYGIVVRSGGSLEASGNTFRNNAEGDINRE